MTIYVSYEQDFRGHYHVFVSNLDRDDPAHGDDLLDKNHYLVAVCPPKDEVAAQAALNLVANVLRNGGANVVVN